MLKQFNKNKTIKLNSEHNIQSKKNKDCTSSASVWTIRELIQDMLYNQPVVSCVVRWHKMWGFIRLELSVTDVNKVLVLDITSKSLEHLAFGSSEHFQFRNAIIESAGLSASLFLVCESNQCMLNIRPHYGPSANQRHVCLYLSTHAPSLL